MEQKIIRTTDELLAFIKRKEIKTNDAIKIVEKALNVFICSDYSKDQLIKETEHFINNYCQEDTKERPLFFRMYLPDIGNRK